ncbi:hypothetical protein I546_3104 [Mycobacterium kansasii 732]|nr:hypothetical protein I546_3104 [Mycobacterium kansasii 732]
MGAQNATWDVGADGGGNSPILQPGSVQVSGRGDDPINAWRQF